MNACAEHREFLVAAADGETGLVPAEALEHFQRCPDCRRELEVHRALAARLSLAMESPAAEAGRAPTAKRRRLLPVAVAALAGALMAAVAVAVTLSRPDPVVAAAQVASLAPQYRSADAGKIGTWCQRASGRSMPEVALPTLTPTGARMDQEAGAGIVTISYRGPDGQPVEVSWLDSNSATGANRSVAARQINGRLILVVASPDGTAVVSGPAPVRDLWQVAALVVTG
jgi:hypothetical protein